jgi:hypothetical protein
MKFLGLRLIRFLKYKTESIWVFCRLVSLVEYLPGFAVRFDGNSLPQSLSLRQNRGPLNRIPVLDP